MSDSYIAILNAKPIPKEFWRELSKGAWSNRPHHETLLPYHIGQLSEALAKQLDETGTIDEKAEVQVRGPDIPGDLDAVAEDAEPLTQADVMALLVQFLRAERDGIVAGSRLNALHYLILCGVYAVRRERYVSLRELVELDYLRPESGAILYLPSGLKWPLVITQHGAAKLEELLHVQSKIPTFWTLRTPLLAWLRSVPLLGDLARKRLPGS
jgi:hypothetical protein